MELDELSGQGMFEKELKVPVILSFTLDEPESKELNLALDLVIDKEERNLSRGQALVRLARFYLKNHQVPTGE